MQQLMTVRGENLKDTPWDRYPRPQMRRDLWMNLNGDWEFAAGEPDFDGKTIRVPFCPESALSGVGQHFGEGTALWYRRKLVLPEGFNRGRVLLHIGAADQRAEVYVNGTLTGSHEGGYEAFRVDITDVLQEENEIRICCRDDLKDQSFPYGKQTKNRGGMWYTPVSGIWQTVWLESVPETYIEKLKVENRGYSVTISTVPALDGRVIVKDLGEFELRNGSVTVTPENPQLWSPEDPHLYEFSVETEEDRVESYFALRSLEIRKVGDHPRLCLNGKPYFFHGVLDQGYWPDGILTPAAPECYDDDILAMKSLGFNTLRKHIKVEPEEFYCRCDKLGMIVFQDMVNNSDYNFIRDTALPTVLPGYQKRSDKNLHPDETHRRRFLEGMKATVEQLQNHPCICYWTIFNEGWGQFDADEVYEQFRKLDDTRFIDATSGWFRREKSDVDSRHVYFRKVRLRGDGKKPLILSEFGGKTLRMEGHVFDTDRTYGYGGCKTAEELNKGLETLYLEEVLPCIRHGLCGAVYTQVSDVEEEINGLMTYDRRVIKPDIHRMQAVAAALQQAILEKEVANPDKIG